MLFLYALSGRREEREEASVYVSSLYICPFPHPLSICLFSLLCVIKEEVEGKWEEEA